MVGKIFRKRVFNFKKKFLSLLLGLSLFAGLFAGQGSLVQAEETEEMKYYIGDEEVSREQAYAELDRINTERERILNSSAETGNTSIMYKGYWDNGRLDASGPAYIEEIPGLETSGHIIFPNYYITDIYNFHLVEEDLDIEKFLIDNGLAYYQYRYGDMTEKMISLYTGGAYEEFLPENWEEWCDVLKFLEDNGLNTRGNYFDLLFEHFKELSVILEDNIKKYNEENPDNLFTMDLGYLSSDRIVGYLKDQYETRWNEVRDCDRNFIVTGTKDEVLDCVKNKLKSSIFDEIYLDTHSIEKSEHGYSTVYYYSYVKNYPYNSKIRFSTEWLYYKPPYEDDFINSELGGWVCTYMRPMIQNMERFGGAGYEGEQRTLNPDLYTFYDGQWLTIDNSDNDSWLVIDSNGNFIITCDRADVNSKLDVYKFIFDPSRYTTQNGIVTNKNDLYSIKYTEDNFDTQNLEKEGFILTGYRHSLYISDKCELSNKIYDEIGYAPTVCTYSKDYGTGIVEYIPLNKLVFTCNGKGDYLKYEPGTVCYNENFNKDADVDNYEIYAENGHLYTVETLLDGSIRVGYFDTDGVHYFGEADNEFSYSMGVKTDYADGSKDYYIKNEDNSVVGISVDKDGLLKELHIDSDTETVQVPELEEIKGLSDDFKVTGGNYTTLNIPEAYKPVVEEPVETEKPSSTEKPSETQKPSSTEKPVETEKPSSTQKPGSTDNPSSTQKPNNNITLKDRAFYNVVGNDDIINLSDAQKILKYALGIERSEVRYTLLDAQTCLKLALGIIRFN